MDNIVEPNSDSGMDDINKLSSQDTSQDKTKAAQQNGQTEDKSECTEGKDDLYRCHETGMYPTEPDIPSSRPWFKTYERYGVAKTIDMPPNNTSLLDVFERNFALYSKRDAYICMGKSITYHELDTYSLKIAVYLQSIGLQKGDKVAIMMPNILQYPIVALGIIRAGMILVNFNPLYTSHEVEHQLKDSGTKAIFLIENFAKTFQDVADKSQVEHVVICSYGDMLGKVKGAAVNTVVRHVKHMVPYYTLEGSVTFKTALAQSDVQLYKTPKLNLSHVVLLQYTAGTIGVAKGAMLTHGNIIANVLQLNTVIDAAFGSVNNDGEVVLTALPLSHVFSFMVCGMLTLYEGGAGLLIPEPRHLNSLVKEIKKYSPSIIPAVNTLFSSLVNHPGFQELDFSNLKAAIGGGMPVHPKVAKAWQDVTGLPIIEGYGLSETSPVVSLNPMSVYEFNGKIGIPLPETDVILIDDNERVIAAGERGEICVKGPQVMVGYYNKSQKTQHTFTKEGYFKTGDIGILDNKGYLKIVDRKKDMILVSGFNVYPNEIEEVVGKHPAVLEVGAIGVTHHSRGEEPKIFVVKKDGLSVTEQELLEFSGRQLTGYKRPRHVQFVDNLPKSNVGKVLRKELRKMEGLE